MKIKSNIISLWIALGLIIPTAAFAAGEGSNAPETTGPQVPTVEAPADGVTPVPPVRPDRPDRPERPEVPNLERPDRPDRPDRPELPSIERIREMVQTFQQQRDDYMAQLEQIKQQWREATDEEKATIRERLQDRRQQFAELQQERRLRIRERIQEMKEELANHQEVIEAAKEQQRDRIQAGSRGGLE